MLTMSIVVKCRDLMRNFLFVNTSACSHNREQTIVNSDTVPLSRNYRPMACCGKVMAFGIGLRNVVIGAMLLIVTGCGTSDEVREAIDRAERYVEERPDSAITILQAIDRDEVKGRHDNARYALIYSEALYYSRIETTSDSLTGPMADYYLLAESEHAERARALYQHSLVLLRKGESADALYMLLEAQKSLSEIDNLRLKGLVHNTIGTIYGSQCLFANALESYIASRDAYREAELEYHYIFATYHIGETYLLKQEYDNAEVYLTEVANTLDWQTYPALMCHTLHKLCDLYIQTSEIDKCRDILTLLSEYECQLYLFNHYYLVLAVVESFDGNADKAQEYLELAESYPDDYNAEGDLYRCIIYQNIGDLEQALYWNTVAKQVQDRLMLNILDYSVLNSQMEIIEEDKQSLERAIIKKQIGNLLIIVACISLVIAIAIYLYRKNKRHRSEVDNYISTIANLNQMLEQTPVGMSEDVIRLYEERFKELNELCDVYYTYIDSTKQQTFVVNQLQTIIDSISNDAERIAELERIVNMHHDNAMKIIDEACPKLSSRKRYVALYHIAGFSLRAISIFIQSNPNSVSKMRYKIKAEIKDSDHPDRDRVADLL